MLWSRLVLFVFVSFYVVFVFAVWIGTYPISVRGFDFLYLWSVVMFLFACWDFWHLEQFTLYQVARTCARRAAECQCCLLLEEILRAISWVCNADWCAGDPHVMMCYVIRHPRVAHSSSAFVWCIFFLSVFWFPLVLFCFYFPAFDFRVTICYICSCFVFDVPYVLVFCFLLLLIISVHLLFSFEWCTYMGIYL